MTSILVPILVPNGKYSRPVCLFSSRILVPTPPERGVGQDEITDDITKLVRDEIGTSLRKGGVPMTSNVMAFVDGGASLAKPEVVQKVRDIMNTCRDLSLPDIIERSGCNYIEVWRAVDRLQIDGKVYFDWEPDFMPDGRSGRKQWHPREATR